MQNGALLPRAAQRLASWGSWGWRPRPWVLWDLVRLREGFCLRDAAAGEPGSFSALAAGGRQALGGLLGDVIVPGPGLSLFWGALNVQHAREKIVEAVIHH